MWVHVRTASVSTHNLCFLRKIRQNVYPCKLQFYFIKVGRNGVYITRTCYPDAYNKVFQILEKKIDFIEFFDERQS